MPSPNDGPTVTESWARTTAKEVRFKFTWTIDNFSSRPEGKDECIESPTFPAGSDNELKWTLQVYPKGDEDSYDYLSVFLNLVSSRFTKADIPTKFDFAILNDKYEKAQCTTTEHQFEPGPESKFGVDFIELDSLFNKANGLLPDDNLTIVCEGTSTVYTHTFRLAKHEASPTCSFPENLFSLFEGEEFSDVTLSVDGKDIPAHKIILAARSPVFAATFKYAWEEKKLNRVVITDVKYEVLREMLRYIYSGKSPNLEKIAEDLLVAADKYDLSELKKMCEMVLGSQLTVANAATLLVLADTYCAQLLKAEAINFAITHAEEMMLTPTWNNMNFSHPHIIMEVLSKKVLALQLPCSDGATRTAEKRSEDSDSDY